MTASTSIKICELHVVDAVTDYLVAACLGNMILLIQNLVKE
jgi:hypothetical protein